MGVEEQQIVQNWRKLEAMGWTVSEHHNVDAGKWNVVANCLGLSLYARSIKVTTPSRLSAWRAVLGAARALEA